MNSVETRERSMLWEWVKFRERWMPELISMESRVGWSLMTLFIVSLCLCLNSREGGDRDVIVKELNIRICFTENERDSSRVCRVLKRGLTYLPFWAR